MRTKRQYLLLIKVRAVNGDTAEGNGELETDRPLSLEILAHAKNEYVKSLNKNFHGALLFDVANAVILNVIRLDD
jgi:hypothetical protein